MLESGLARALARLLIACGVMQIITVSIAQSQALNNSPMIFDVRRSLPLEPNEPVYHDFYIDSGPEAGFKRGMFISVVRGVPVHDPFQNKQQGILKIPVATLRVIHVDRNITVARLHSQLNDKERPTLEFEAVMIGDRIDPSSMTMEEPKRSNEKNGEKEKKSWWKSTQGTEPSQEPSVELVVESVKSETVSVETKKTFPEASAPDMVREPAAIQTTTPL